MFRSSSLSMDTTVALTASGSVRRNGDNAEAVAIGCSHGIYKARPDNVACSAPSLGSVINQGGVRLAFHTRTHPVRRCCSATMVVLAGPLYLRLLDGFPP